MLTRYLAEHAVDVHAPERLSYSVLAIEKYVAFERARGGFAGVVTLDQVGLGFVRNYAEFRRGVTGGGTAVADSTIRRELATLRAAINWAAEGGVIATRPYVPKLQGKARLKVRRRENAYSLPQLAAILEAALGRVEREHVHLFVIAMLASHARTEAIIDCNLDTQLQDGVIDWLGPDREQTKKRRAVVPVGPTFASWLEGRSGKLIACRMPVARKKWKKDEVPEFRIKAAWSIKHAFENALLAAGAAHPTLGLRVPVLDRHGAHLTRLIKVRSAGGAWGEERVPLWSGVGSPNTVRHTIHSQLRRIGVPKAQIDAAAGHAEQGTGENYNHFDARHDFNAFTAGVEQLFDELRAYTTVHLRSRCGPKVLDLGAFRAGKAG